MHMYKVFYYKNFNTFIIYYKFVFNILILHIK